MKSERLEMNPLTSGVGELLYEAEIHFTNIVEYGVSIEQIASGSTPLPPEGVRFDYPFQGVLRGPRLSGSIAGTDYMNIRADRCFQLHIHAQITTDDGANISLSSEGLSVQEQDNKEAQLRAAISLFTSSSRYTWLNRLPVWAIGTIDIERGELRVKAYEA